MSKHLGIVITDGVGFRNFILSDFYRECVKSFEKVTIYSCLPLDVYNNFVSSDNVKVLEVFPDNFFTWFFQKLKETAHLQKHQKDNFGIQDSIRLNKQFNKTNRGRTKRFIFLFTKLFHSENWIQRFNQLQKFTFKNHFITKKYIDILASDRPDFLFFTHQRPPYIAPLIYAAEVLKISKGTFIFSWDNLASKGRMAGNFDYYFVWSNLMKSELLDFYSLIERDQTFVVGTPQFEPYVLNRYATDKQSFSQKFNLDEAYKTICFSCGDVSTSKNDPIYIETIAEAIKHKKINGVNFLVRTSPAETPQRFEYLKVKYPFIVWNYPKWPLRREGHQEIWSQRVPQEEDMLDLRGILSYCDVFVNMCSTMSLDAMCFDKPVINPVFGNDINGLYNDQRFLKYAHYKKVVESGAVGIAKNPESLINQIKEALQHPEIRSQEQRSLLKLQVGHSLQDTSKNFVKTLNSILDGV